MMSDLCIKCNNIHFLTLRSRASCLLNLGRVFRGASCLWDELSCFRYVLRSPPSLENTKVSRGSVMEKIFR